MIYQKRSILDFSLGQPAKAARSKSTSQMDREALARKFMQLLERNYSEQHSPRYYADALKVSLYKLNSVLMAQYGKTAYKLIQSRLNQRVLKLLKDPKIPLYRIGMEVGIHDPAWFTRSFKKVHGISPLQYRKTILLSLS